MEKIYATMFINLSFVMNTQMHCTHSVARKLVGQPICS